MNDNKAPQRLQSLFADLERLAVGPRGDTAAIKYEIAHIGARLHELEGLIRNDQGSYVSSEPENIPMVLAPMLDERPARFQFYEEDKVAFAFSNEKLERLPDASQAIPGDYLAVASPLTAGGQIIGEVQIVPRPEDELSTN